MATNGSVTTRHLLDMQPGLTQVIASTTRANVTRTVHAAHGVFSQKDSAGNWEWLLNDGLGSVRGVVSNAGSVLEHRHFDPFGNLYAGTMSQTDFGFTGEQFDAATGLLYLRARHYRPGIGSFVSRDPYEGMMARPMSRNGYSWVEGRVADGRDPSGMNSSLCGIPYTAVWLLQQLPTVTPVAPPCPLRDAYGVDVLSYTAARETAAIGSELRSDYHALAALMLMQVNAFRTPNQQGQSGYWTPIGVSGADPQTAFVNQARTNNNATRSERTLAGLLVNGVCDFGDPLYYFSSQADPILRQSANSVYPQVSENYSRLQQLAGAYGVYETALKNEVSVHADRAMQLQSDWPNTYIVTGGGRAVVITTPGLTRPRLLYQCPSSAVAITPNGNPSQFTSLSPSSNHTCHSSCNFSEFWLWLGQGESDRPRIEQLLGRTLSDANGNFASVNAAERGRIRAEIAGRDSDYVKTC